MERKSQRSADRLGIKQRWEAGLLASTALSAVLALPIAAPAQSISATATPQGGVVVGGSASITQAPASTTIDQTSQRAAIDFQSFDVGSAAKVQINQPDANSVELDRVVGGNLSQINGQIDSNGQVVLINQSGVVFGKGSQVNAENIVVSTSNIATSDFMAGHMVFSGAPNPGAKIINDGQITARNAGLVGLVAPQVANNGVITAQLGQVVLAGASAFTLDMYGDRLISLDVTRAVRAVDVGGKLVPALVTNSGLILADGGKVTLTAQDADALVTQLINAGGTIRANSVGGNAGTISIQGVGGDISIAGNLLAQGQNGAHGGNIQALTTGTVAVAAGAVVDASGDTGGGVIALGTDIARAETGAADVSAPKAARVIVAPNAVVRADATANGNGGKITLLSRQDTDFAGTISVAGGPDGGNGGLAEISSDGVISLNGTVIDSASRGASGEILLDPATLVVGIGSIVAGSVTVGGNITYGTDNSTVSYISPTVLDGLSGTIVLQASTLISVASAVSIASANSALSIVSGGDVSINNSIYVNGSLEIDAANLLNDSADLSANGILLKSGNAGSDINAGVTAGVVMLGSTGTIFEGSAGSIIASNLFSVGSIGGNATLASANNIITTLGSFTVGGNLTLANTGGLTIAGSVNAANVSLSGASLTFESNVSAKGLLALTSTGTISQGAGTIAAGTLSGNADGLFVLDHSGNSIGTLGPISATGGAFALSDTGSLNVAGNVSAQDVYISVPTLGLNAKLAATLGSAATLAVAANSIAVAGGSFSVPQGRLDITPLSAGTVIDIGKGASAGTLGLPGSIVAAFDTGASIIEIGNGVIGTQARAISIDGSSSFASGPILDLSTSGTISDNSGTLQAGILAFDASAFTQAPAAALAVTQLQGDGGPIAGNIVLYGTANAIQTLASLQAGGTLNVLDTGTLGIAGTVSAGNVSLAAPSLVLAADGTLAANGTNPSLVLSGNTISAGTGSALLAPGGTIALAPDTTGRAIAINGTSAAGTLGIGADVIGAIGAGASEIVIGNSAAGNITIASGTIAVAAPLDLSTGGSVLDIGTLAGGTILFDAPGGFTQALGGAISAALFGGDGGSIGGNVVLDSAGNTIGALGSFAGAIGTLSIIDTGALTIAGAIDPAVVTLSADTLVISNDISVSSRLALGSSGSITQSGGSITAPILVSYGSIGGDATLASATNSIGTLGGFTLGGALDLVDGGPLKITGPVTGYAVSLSSATINLAGDVTAGALALGSSGTITQTAGSIAVGSLVSLGSVGGNVLLNAANSITTLGAFTLGGNLTLNDASSLDIAGTVATPGAVTLSGTSLSESTGALTIGSLSTGAGSFTGAVNLTGANSIATLGNFTLSGTGPLTLNDLSILAIKGLVNVPGGSFEFTGGGVSETGAGVIDAASFTTGGQTVAGDILLTGANHIGVLDSAAAAGTLALNDNATLSLQDQITAQDIYLSAPTVNLSTGLPSQVIAGSAGSPGTLALAANAYGIGAGTAALDAPGGTIELAAYAPGMELDIGNSTAVGVIDLPGSVFANVGSDTAKILIGNGAIGTQASGILIDQSVSFGGTTIVDLSTSGTISQNSGIFAASTLEFDAAGFRQKPGAALQAGVLAGDGGSIGGSVLLTGTSNLIGELTAMSLSSGTLGINDVATLTVAGTVSAPVISLSAFPGVIVSGSLNAPTELALGSGGGGIFETGSISTGLLVSDGTIADDAILTGTNSIGTLGGFTLFGDLALNDMRALDIAGAVNSAGNVSLTGTSLTESTGSVAANTLTTGAGSFSGNVLLLGTSNNVATLGAFTLASGTLALNDTGALTIGGAVSAPTTNLFANTSIDIAGAINAPTQLALGSFGTITQTAGTISTGSLVSDGSIGGDLILLGANSISGLGNVTLGGNFQLNDAASLNVPGLVQATSSGSEIVLEDASTILAGGTLLADIVGLSAANSIDLAGEIDAPTLLALAGGVITQTAGTLIAGSLSSGGVPSTGDVSLTGSANRIAAVGQFVTSGTFALANNGALAINGPVTAGHVTIADQGIITLGGEVAGTLGQVTLLTDGLQETSGGTVAAPGGTIALAPFTAGLGVDIGGTQANALDLSGDLIAALDPTAKIIRIGGADTGNLTSEGDVVVSNPTLVLTSGGVVTQTGTLSGNDIQITGNALTLNGTVGATMLELASAGSISQNQSGLIAAGTLLGLGVTGGDVSLAGTANAIGTLGNFDVNGYFSALDASALVVTGSVAAHNIALTENGAGAGNSLAIDGTLTAGAGGSIALTADNMSAANAAIVAPGGTVALSPYDFGTAIDLGGTSAGLDLSNALIGAIDPRAALLKITTTGPLTTDGNVTIQPGSVLLSGNGISFNGNLNLPGASTLALASTNGITAARGETLTAGLLEGFGTITGPVALGQGLNYIGTLGGFSVTGTANDFALADALALTVENPLSARNIGLSAAGLTIANVISATSGITLGSSNGILETSAGALDGATLNGGTAAIGGDVLLTAGNNHIGTLAGIILSGGTLNFADNGSLNVAGQVSAGQITLVADTIGLSGQVTAGSVLALDALSGGVSQSSGLISAPTLTSDGATIGGDVQLGSTANAIGTLGGFAATGGIRLNDASALAIAGLVTTPGSLSLEGAGPIHEITGGLIDAGTLDSGGTAIGGDVSLGNANTIAALGDLSLSAGHTLSLTDTAGLTVAGTVVATDATLVAASITVPGSIAASGQLALGTAGAVSENGNGAISTGTLISSGTIGGDVTLAGANQVGTLGVFALGGTLALADAGLLTVAGSVSGSAVSLAAGTIDLAGNIIAPDQIALGSTGNITQTAGSLSTGNLISQNTIGGNVTLGGANQIGTLGIFALGGTLAFVDNGLLTVAGPVSGSAVSLAAGTIDLAGNITAPSQIALGSTGNIVQSAGTISTGHLISQNTIGGDVILADANQVGTLGVFAAGGTLDLVDAGLLTVAGPVTAPVVSLSAGTISLAGNIAAPDQIALGGTGTIIQSAGVLATSHLISQNTIGGDAILADANQIGTLGGFNAGGNVILNDAGSLALTGPVTAANLTLSAAGLAVNGLAATPGTFAIASTAGVTEGGNGQINANVLSTGASTVTGNIGLNNAANSIATLGSLAATGGLTLNDAIALGLTAPVHLGGTLALGNASSITQTGGFISAAALTSDGGTIGGDVVLSENGNQIPVLGSFATDGDLTVNDASALTLKGNVSAGNLLNLYAATLSQASGAITVGTLNASASSITLTDPNTIGALGSIAAIGLLDVNGASSLTGPVSAASATITTGGDFTLAGNATIGGGFSLNAGGAISQTGGTIAAQTENLAATGNITQTAGSLSAQTVTLTGTDITLGGDVNATTKLNIDPRGGFTQTGGEIGAPIVAISATSGGVLQSAGSLIAQTATISGGNVALGGYTSITNTLDINATGNLIHSAGTLDAGYFEGTAPNFASFGSVTDFGTLGSFTMNDSQFILSNNGPLTIAGPVTANSITINAVGQITLAGASGGGLNITGSIAPNQTPAPRPGDSVITATAGANSPASIVQTGDFYVNSNNAPATLFLYTGPSGTVTFAPYPDALMAPSVDIVIGAGPGGVVTGNIDVEHLEILSAQSVDLTGIMMNRSGSAAAASGSVDPFPQPNYRFNSCPIGSVNCTILPIESVPVGNPLDNFDIKKRKRKKLDHNVELPGIATRDY